MHDFQLPPSSAAIISVVWHVISTRCNLQSVAAMQLDTTLAAKTSLSLPQDWIRRLRALLQQGAAVEGSPEEEQLSRLMNQYAQV